MAKLVAMKPDNWSEYRLLYWLLQSNLDFNTTPPRSSPQEDE